MLIEHPLSHTACMVCGYVYVTANGANDHLYSSGEISFQYYLYYL